jgi:5-methylcytosine-specific restriction endonuclease McrA
MSGLAQPVNDLQLDHIIPLASGGSNDPTNFQLACATCNQKKGKQLTNSVPRFAPYW